MRNYYFGKNRKQADEQSTPHKEPGATRRMYQRAIVDAFAKLDPRWMIHNPGDVCNGSGQRFDDGALGTSV